MTALGIIILILLWLIVCLVGHGYTATVDNIAWMLHRHAGRVRGMHRRREAVVRERWVRALEETDA